MKNLLRVSFLVLVLGAVSLGAYQLFNHATPAPSLALGAAPGPDQIGFNPYSWNGVGLFYYSSKFQLGTTTPCDFTSPNATTTLAAFSANLTTGTSTATVIGLYRSSTPTATTSLLAQLSLSAGALATLNATSTIPGLTDKIIAPKSHLVFGVSGGTGVSNDIGSCNVKLDRV